MNRFLHHLLHFQLSHPVITVCVALSLALLSAVLAYERLTFQTSSRALMSHDAALMERLKLADWFADRDAFVVAVENRSPERTIGFASALAERLKGDREHFQEVLSRVDPEGFRSWSLLYLPENDLLDLQNNLHEYQAVIMGLTQSPSLATLFESINRTMTASVVNELFTGFLKEKPNGAKRPLKLDFLINLLGQMKERTAGSAGLNSPWRSMFFRQNSENEAEEGYFWTENKKYLLIFASPVLKGSGFSKAQQALEALRQAVNTVKKDFPDVDAGVTGQKALDEDQKTGALKDASVATVISLLGLVILLVLSWRSIRRPFLVITTLVIALCLTFGFTTLIIGHLNILSVAFAPMILGLGIDYGIHSFARLGEEQRKSGRSSQEALEATMVSLGPALILAGVCASLSFLPLAFTGFKGLAELGIICAIGMALALMVSLCPLPALIVLLEGRTGDRRRSGMPVGVSVRPLFHIGSSWACLVLSLAAVSLGVSLWATIKVPFDLNMLRLQSTDAESVIWEYKLIEGSRYPSIYGVIFAHSREELDAKTRSLASKPTVSEVQSIDTLLPPDQNRKIDLLRQMNPLLKGITTIPRPSLPVSIDHIEGLFSRIRSKMVDADSADMDDIRGIEGQMKEVVRLIDSIRSDFHSLDRFKLKQTLKAFEQQLFLDLNDKLAILLANMNTRPMEISDLPEELRSRFMSPDGLYLIRVFPAQNVWDPRYLAPFVRDLTAVDPNAVGDPVMLNKTTKAFRDASIKAAAYAVALICLVLVFTLRSPVSAILALTPFFAGTLWTFGLMYLLGIDLNLANSIFLPLVVGAGAEYGVVIVKRWKEEPNRLNFSLPSSTGTGIILAGLSTTIGFGSLAISSHRGIYSLGVLAAVGSMTVLFAATIILPSLLQVMTRLYRKSKEA